MAQRSKSNGQNQRGILLPGVLKYSAGCLNCYAERMAKRLKAIGNDNYKNGFQVTLHPDILERPLSWKTPQTIFVNSMSDLFHEDIPEDFIVSIFDIMKRASWHRFQILTKRSQRLLEMNARLDWPDNVWMGVTVERNDYVFRIDHLRQTHAAI
jgi:protein gp37